MTTVAVNYSPQVPSSSREPLNLTTPSKTEVNPWDTRQYGLLSPPFDPSAWPLDSPSSVSPSLPYSLQRSINNINAPSHSDDQDLFTPRNLSQPKTSTALQSPFLPSPSPSPVIYSNKSIASSPSAFPRTSVSSDSSIPFVHAVAEIGYKFPLEQNSIPLPEDAATPKWEEGDTSIALRTPLGNSLELAPQVPLIVLASVKIENDSSIGSSSPQVDHVSLVP